MNRLVAGLNLTRFISRRMSWRSRPNVSVRRQLARLLAGIVGATLLVASQSLDQSPLDASVDALGSIAPAATVPALHSAASQRLTSESRSTSRWSTCHYAAIPSAAQALPIAEATIEGAANASIAVCTAALSRGYDATAPPALS